MAVANGVARNVVITTNYKESVSGRESKFYTYPYVTYNKNNGLVSTNQIENYILFERTVKLSDFSISSAYGRAGNIVVAGAKLDVVTGNFIPLKENETFYLRQDGTLAPLNSTSTSYVFSDSVRKELNDKGPGGLYQQSVNGLKTVFQKDSGLSSQQVTGIYSGILGTGSSAPGAASIDVNPPQPPVASPTQVRDPFQPITTEDAEGVGTAQFSLSDFNVTNENPQFANTNFGELHYPKGVQTNGQDIVKFEILELAPRTERSANTFSLNSPSGQRNRGTIYLGIQPRIQDTNTVNWAPDKLNVLEYAGQATALGLMTEQTPDDIVSKLKGTANNEAMKNAALAKLAQVATGSNNGLFTRLTGAIINSNLELIFQGPELRNFQFSFSMTPRDPVDEAKNVKKIIRAFKQASAVQVGYQYLFLKSPFVFKIQYMTPKKSNGDFIIHPSLNRIKTCALTSMSVDYTPAGTYMTYTDENVTMTSYNVQLQFTELEPVYDVNYNEVPADHIGF